MILDNRHHGSVIDTLLREVQTGATLSIVTRGLSLFALHELSGALKGAGAIRILLTCPDFGTASLLGDESERIFRNKLEQSHIAREMLALLKSASVEIRLLASPNLTASSLTIAQNPDGTLLSIQGSSDLTLGGLGVAATERFDINTLSTEEVQVHSLLEWFDRLWGDTRHVADFKAPFQAMLRQIATALPSKTLYFSILHTLFEHLGEELNEERIIRSKTGFKTTQIWSKLYPFQKDAVTGAIEKLEKYGGCIIADSVGLGKTFEALAVIKYYELRNDRVLVLCPKKLRENWSLFTINDKRNPLTGDRFSYDVLNHTDLTRNGGTSGGINLATLNWGNYDLLVIDESHNFRNNNPKKEGLTRYQKLMQQIIQSGVKTKVLMLSATPVNNRLADLKNQIAFITEGDDGAFSEEGIESIETLLQRRKPGLTNG